MLKNTEGECEREWVDKENEIKNIGVTYYQQLYIEGNTQEAKLETWSFPQLKK